MIRVILESPYAGDRSRNERYARACMRDSLSRGEARRLGLEIYTLATLPSGGFAMAVAS